MAQTLRQAAGTNTPDVICLAEVGDKTLGARISSHFKPAKYGAIWSGVPVPVGGNVETGLMVLYRTPQISIVVGAPQTGGAQTGGRHKWMSTIMTAASGASFRLVVAHWSSDFRKTAKQADALRIASAREIADLVRTSPHKSSEPVLMLGDFNCEPFDAPFSGMPNTNRILCIRERKKVKNHRNRLLHMYNPMWRLLGEAATLERARSAGYVAERPVGTWCRDKNRQEGWRTLDQIVVSSEFLGGGPLTVEEGSIRIVHPLHGCTDHAAVGCRVHEI